MDGRLGRGEVAGELVMKLQQLTTKMTNSIIARDLSFKELKEVREERNNARNDLREYRQK